MTPNPDSNPDKVSGLADWPEPRTGIPTIIPTKCRDSSAARWSDNQSSQTSRHTGGISTTVAEQEGNPAKPAILAGYAASLPGHLSGHIVRLPEHHTA